MMRRRTAILLVLVMIPSIMTACGGVNSGGSLANVDYSTSQTGASGEDTLLDEFFALESETANTIKAGQTVSIALEENQSIEFTIQIEE